MVITSGMMSSATDEWATPLDLFNELDREFGFTLDVCADESNHKCCEYYTKEQDGLKQDWKGICWMNPPYGRVIGRWVRKAMESAHDGTIVVCLVPARTDTKWWQDYAMKATEIRLIAGRVKFGEAAQGAPFPSAVLVFGTPTTPVFRKMIVNDGCPNIN